MFGLGKALSEFHAWQSMREHERNARRYQEQVISNVSSASQRNSMQKFCSSKEDIARFVRKCLNHLDVGSQLIIRIEREKFGEYFVTGVTSSLSEDTPAETDSGQQQTT